MKSDLEAARTFDEPARVHAALADAFGGRRVVVVGDLMLDRYLWGAATRISPEAPVPVVAITRETETAGGAGNVAMNLRGLGLEVDVAGYVGDDDAGRRLCARLGEAGIAASAVVVAGERPTVTKTRVLGGHQQMLRFDAEVSSPLASELSARVADLATARLDGAAALVLSDYAKGTLEAPICRRLIAEARARGIPVLVDPKGLDYAKYAGATTVTPNKGELALATGNAGSDLDELLARGEALRDALGLGFLTVTRGAQGVTYLGAGRPAHLGAQARAVFDVSGAGDTMIATLAAGLAAGLGDLDALRLANLAAGIIVSKLGTAAIGLDELFDAVRAVAKPAGSAGKLLARAETIRCAERWREAGERVVFTNGCFDLLHVGHVVLLERARAEGDRLIVGVNTDRSVRALKGPARPMVAEGDRALVLAALAAADVVTLFDEETPLELVRALRPDVLVKGGDYCRDDIVGAPEVLGWGGRVEIIPLVEGQSTSRLVVAASGGNVPRR